jgi:hypothetical protein
MNLCLALGQPVTVSVKQPNYPAEAPDYKLLVMNADWTNAEVSVAHLGAEGGWVAVLFPAESGCRIVLDVTVGCPRETTFLCGFGTDDNNPYVGWGNAQLPLLQDSHLLVATEVPVNVDGHAALIFWPMQPMEWDVFSCTISSF